MGDLSAKNNVANGEAEQHDDLNYRIERAPK